MRKQRDMERQKIQEAIYLSKKEEVKQQRFVQVQNKQRKNVFFNQAANDAAMKNQRKQMDVKNDLDKRVGEEEAVIRNKEQEVMQMEMLEMELIKKLQNTQAIQKQAYAELENALSKQGGASYTSGGGMHPFGKISGGAVAMRGGASGGGAASGTV